jgi:hypothetical protein
MNHILAVLLVVVSHYGCCHHLGGAVIERIRVARSPTPPDVPEVPLPPTPPIVRMESDIFSLVYTNILSDASLHRLGKTPFPIQVSELPEPQTCTSARVPLEAPHCSLVVALLTIPSVLFVSTTIPSLYACGSFGKKALCNANIVILSTIAYALLTYCASTDSGVGSPWLSTTLGMHASVQICMQSISLITGTNMVIPHVCSLMMHLCAAFICFAISLSGRTSMANYDECAFYQAHLIAILLLEIASPPIWYMTRRIAELC